jgi:hypothetical protein
MLKDIKPPQVEILPMLKEIRRLPLESTPMLKDIKPPQVDLTHMLKDMLH